VDHIPLPFVQGTARGTRPMQRYPLRDFLQDRDATARAQARAVNALDGRLWSFDVGALAARDDRRTWFSRKYGPLGRERAWRFDLVLRFLGRHAEALVEAGLAVDSAECLAVREELVHHLLEYPVADFETEIPARAYREFLDSWGHRWM
jgi:hypothetical protein